jgi:uncharacterized protein YukE
MAELEPLLPYDTGAMRALAQALKSQAGTLSAVAGQISSASGSLVFDGPAGDRIRAVLARVVRSANDCASRLGDAAGRVESSASDIDRQNAIIRAHNQAVLDALPPVTRKLVQEGV